MWGGMLAAQLVCAALMLRAVVATDWEEQTERARELTGGNAGDVVDGGKRKHAEAAKADADNSSLVLADCV